MITLGMDLIVQNYKIDFAFGIVLTKNIQKPVIRTYKERVRIKIQNFDSDSKICSGATLNPRGCREWRNEDAS